MKRISVISFFCIFFVILNGFVCYAEDNENILLDARNKLVFSVLTDEDIENITENLYLPSRWEGTDVYWTSSNETLLNIDGETGIIKRPPHGDGRVCVVLSANMSCGNQTVTKNFMVRIKEMSIGRDVSSPLEKLRDDFDREFLSNQNILAIRNNLIFPNVSGTYMRVDYVSENPDVISSDGKVTRSLTEDKIVNFTVNFSYGYEITRLTYSVIVKAISTDEIESMLQEDLDWVVSKIRRENNLNRVEENISLPTTGPNNTKISYVSSNVDIMSNTGTVSLDDESHQISLVVTVNLRGKELSEMLEIKILPKNNYGSSNSGNGTSSSGSTNISGGNGNVVMHLDKLTYDTKSFPDVENSHWAAEAIRVLKDKGVVNGDEKGNFRPDDLLTREELVKMIVVATRVDLEISSVGFHFSDISASDWSFPYIIAAYKNGYINGRDDGSFGKSDYITRQDTSVIIHNVLRYRIPQMAKSGAGEFADISEISPYALTAVKELQQVGLVNGKSNNMFMPKDNLTRSEAATMIWRMLNK